MTDVRAITPNCSGLSRPNCEIVSSVRPSARYSLLGSPVRFWTGSPASLIFSELDGVGSRKLRQDMSPTTTIIDAHPSMTAPFQQGFAAHGFCSLNWHSIDDAAPA